MTREEQWMEDGRECALGEALRRLLRAGWEGKLDSDTRREVDNVLGALSSGGCYWVTKKKLAEHFRTLAELIEKEA